MSRRAFRLLALFLSLTTFPWIANANSEEGFIIAIVNLECPHCREIFKNDAGLKAMTERAGLTFKYAPVPNHGDTERAWAERVYYASRALPGNTSVDVMRSIYDAQDTDPVNTKTRMLAWMQMTMPRVDWTRFFADYVEKEKSLDAVKKALSLAKAVQLRQFPSFVYVGEGMPKMIAGSGDNAELVAQLKRFLETKL